MTQHKKKGPTPPNQGPRRVVRKEPEVVETPRYTPPKRFTYIFRPVWHKVVGVTLLLVGLGLFISCEAGLGNIHSFGGHIWYIVGLAVAISSSWWFGLFDQPA